jgi:hypothetical protein
MVQVSKHDEAAALATCQICGRAIKAKNGVIAHHGYRRPHPYHQTSSCYGARYRPYEVAHDALDSYIVLLEGWLVTAQSALDIYQRNPPASITHQRYDAWGIKRGEPQTYNLPVGFDSLTRPGSWRPRTYEAHYWTSCGEKVNYVSSLTEELSFCRERRAAWRAPS